LCRVIDVLAQMTVKVIDVLAFLGYRCPGTCHIGHTAYQAFKLSGLPASLLPGFPASFNSINPTNPINSINPTNPINSINQST